MRGFRKGESLPVGVGIVVAMVASSFSNGSLVSIVGLDILLLDVAVVTVCASSVVGDIQTNEFLEGIRSEPSSIDSSGRRKDTNLDCARRMETIHQT